MPANASAVLLVRLGVDDFEVLVGARQLLLGIKHLDLLGSRCLPSSSPKTLGFAGACERLSHELGGILQLTEIYDKLQSAARSVILTRSGLALHLVEFDAKDKLLDAYERLKHGPSIDRTHELVEWVPWLALVVAARGGATQTTTRLLVEQFQNERATYRVSEVVKQVLSHHTEEIEGHIEQLVATRTAGAEACPREPLQLPPPIDILEPDEPDFKKICKLLGTHLASRVITIRRVRVPARLEEYEEFEQSSREELKRLEPLYHGTPERWRATAIAMNGFDLTIQRNGRSHGDGVYIGATANASLGYAGDTGSILLLRGLQSKEDYAAHFYVFKNPKALLPLFIADFAAE